MSSGQNQTESGLTRRSLFGLVGGSLASRALPSAKILSRLTTIVYPPDVISTACSFITPFPFGAELKPFNILADLTSGRLKSSSFLAAEVINKELYLRATQGSGLLQRAWCANIEQAFQRLWICDYWAAIIEDGANIAPKTLFSLLERPDTRESLLKSRFENEFDMSINSWPPDRSLDVIDAWMHQHEVGLKDFSALTSKFPQLRTSERFEDVIAALRKEITEALSLPLEDGCLDRFLLSGDCRLNTLLDEVPQLFPSEQLRIFRKWSQEYKIYGRQVSRLEDLVDVQTEWSISCRYLAYRLGLTPLQNIWPPIRAVSRATPSTLTLSVPPSGPKI